MQRHLTILYNDWYPPSKIEAIPNLPTRHNPKNIKQFLELDAIDILFHNFRKPPSH